MDKHRKLVWLASYPKSGNTWFRLFMSALTNKGDVNINDLNEGSIFSRKSYLEEVLDIDTSLFKANYLANIHGLAFEYMAEKSDKLLYFKIHDAFGYVEAKKPLVPVSATFSALYFVRNPLDVSISFANHLGNSIETTIENMNDSGYEIGTQSGRQTFQKLMTWSEHYQSWTQQKHFPVLVIKYEDMLAQPFETFKKACIHAGLEYSDAEILAAINATKFEKLKKQEEEFGFKEKLSTTRSFFNKGQAGTWRNVLTQAQIDRIINDHGAVMKELGYI